MYNAPRPHIHRKVTPEECLNCQRRRVGCHSKCPDYKKFRVKLGSEKTAAFEAVAADRKVAEYEKDIHKQRREGRK